MLHRLGHTKIPYDSGLNVARSIAALNMGVMCQHEPSWSSYGACVVRVCGGSGMQITIRVSSEPNTFRTHTQYTLAVLGNVLNLRTSSVYSKLEADVEFYLHGNL